MRDREEDFTAAGVRVVCVVQARPDELPEECRGARHLACVPDPGKESFRAFGLGRMPPWRLLTSRALWRRRREAARRGYAQDWKRTFARESDGLLLPGAALVAPGGEVVWAHRGEHTGDLPPADELLAVARGQRARTR